MAPQSGKVNTPVPDYVCVVAARSVEHQELGKLSILRINDTQYMVEYKSHLSGDTILIDLDNASLINETQTVNLTLADGKVDSFYVIDHLEYEVLVEAKTECENICDLKLRLNSLLRDVYFSGLYSTLKTNLKMQIKDEVELLKVEAPQLFFGTIPERTENAQQMEKERHILEGRAAKAQCAFCFKVRAIEKDLLFVIHPYVPKTFQGDTIYMCSTCVENWKEYRDAADHQHQLVLENEVNEEVCAVCSDTPETLVLCASCPRSYCSACLNKILSKNDQKALQTDDSDWQCMCCLNGVDALPPLSRDSWVRIRTVNAIDAETAAARQKRKELANAQHADIATSTAAVAASIAPPAPLTVTITEPESGRRSGRATHSKQQSPRAAEYDAVSEISVSEGPITPVVAPTTSTSSNRKSQGKRKAVTIEAPEEVEDSSALPPVTKEFDELYYFSQYVNYIDNAMYYVQHGTKKEILEAQTCTDDSCFLCKDGGELIECDWKHSTKKKTRCLKVYHEYCLEYAVKDGVKWCCPRHFCDVCGSQDLKYICKYCTVSICANCPTELVKQYGCANYSELEDITGEYEGSVPIACHNCIELLNRSFQRPGLLDNLQYKIDLKVKKFPGVPGKKKDGMFRVTPTSNKQLKVEEPKHDSSSQKHQKKRKQAKQEEEHVEEEEPLDEEAVEQMTEDGPLDQAEYLQEVEQQETVAESVQEHVEETEPMNISKEEIVPPIAEKQPSSSSSTSISSSQVVHSSEGQKTPHSFEGTKTPSSRLWSESDIQCLLEGGRIYGTNMDQMMKDPNYSHMLIFRTVPQLKAKLIKLFEIAAIEASTAANTSSSSSSASDTKAPAAPVDLSPSVKSDKGNSSSSNSKNRRSTVKKVVLSGSDALPFL